ncbi:MAG: hypothetical protein OEU26_20420, partial [Candidatus Tectomicrobia bacterium]|nr:hypothetical protein [Candidatus Tectomicrobia bacterium]
TVLKYYSGISGEPLFSEIKEPIYYRRSFNQNGDVVGHLWQSEREIRNDTSIEKESIDKNGDIIINKKVINILNNFEKFSRSRNIKIFMAPPTLRKSLYANYSPMLDRLFDHISRRCHIPVIAKPKDYVFPDHLLFDTSYHLNAEGREQRTKTLISALQQAGLSKTHPYQEINGSSIHEHQILAADQPVVEIDWLHLFEEVPPQATRSPTPITGRVLGASIADVLHIAIAVNGTIKTTTQTYRHGNSTRFAAIIPKDALKAGRNQVDLYTIHRASQELVALTLCTKAAPSPRTASLISHDDDTEVISHLDGTTTFVERGEVAGKINRAKTTDEGLNFIGWAVNAKAQELPEAIMVFVDGDFFYSTQTTHERPDVELTYDNPSLRWSGFNFTLPITFLKASNKPYIRVFALLQNGLAAELQYADPYPWGPKPIRNADRY